MADLVVPAYRPHRVLDFDVENRPLSYLGADFTTGEITAIAWKFIGEDEDFQCVALRREMDEYDRVIMLEQFRVAYTKADEVTGHNIRRHDLGYVNGAMLELSIPPLTPKFTRDTYADLLKKKGVSGSQESLAAALGIEAPKIKMSQADWRAANRLTDEGIELTKRRCIGDVKQHIALRRRLLELGWLRPGKWWAP